MDKQKLIETYCQQGQTVIKTIKDAITQGDNTKAVALLTYLEIFFTEDTSIVHGLHELLK